MRGRGGQLVNLFNDASFLFLVFESTHQYFVVVLRSRGLLESLALISNSRSPNVFGISFLVEHLSQSPQVSILSCDARVGL